MMIHHQESDDSNRSNILVSPSSIIPPQTAPSLVDVENVLTLVGGDDTTNKIILSDSSKECFERGEETILELKSHDGMAVGYFPSSENLYGELIQFFPGLVRKGVKNCIKWKYVDKTWITSTSIREEQDDNQQQVREYDLEIDWPWNGGEQIKERICIRVLHNPFAKERQKLDHKQRSFEINSDGSISPQDDKSLYLGIRGNHVIEENLHDAIGLRCESDVIRNIIGKVDDVNTLIYGTSFLTIAADIGDLNIVTMLLDDFHASPNIENDVYPPLGVAAYRGYQAIVEVLLKKGAERNTPNEGGNSAISKAAITGNIDIINTLLNADADIDASITNSAVCWAIRNNHDNCVKVLVDRGASLDTMYEGKQVPIQLACSKGSTNGLSLATILVRDRGDLSPQQILDMPKEDIDKAMRVFIEAYASLSVKELAQCGARSYLKGLRSQQHNNNQGTNDDWSNYNPFLECTMLAQCVKEQFNKVWKTDTTAADEFNKLFVKLQLVSASILNEIHQDTKGLSTRVQEITKTKEEHLQSFLVNNTSVRALNVSHEIRSRNLFSQPVLFRYFARTWYGKLMYEVFAKHNAPNNFLFLLQVCIIVMLFIMQAPLLLFLGYLPPKVTETLEKMELPQFITNALHLKTKRAFIILEPLSLFLVQCITDLALAVFFLTIGTNQLKSLNILLPTLAIITGALGMEIQEMYDAKNVKTYFMVDMFNILDFTGLVLSTLALYLILIAPQMTVPFKVLLSISSVILWLRALRLLTLYSGTAHLTIIFFSMFKRMTEWIVLLIVIILGFATGVTKLNLVGDENCSYIQSFSFWEFFEDAIAPSNDFFDCTEGGINSMVDSIFGSILICIFILIANILMVNMLIAMMTESFASVWDARASNFAFQRVSHCLEMQGKRDLPIQILYFPYGVFWLLKKILDKFKGCLPSSSHAGNNNNNDEASSIEKYSPFDKEKEGNLTKTFEDYISNRQDEASEEDCWRVTLSKKTTKVEQRLDSMKKEMKQRSDSMKEEMEKKATRVEQRLDSMKEEMEYLKQMLEVLIDKSNCKE